MRSRGRSGRYLSPSTGTRTLMIVSGLVAFIDPKRRTCRDRVVGTRVSMIPPAGGRLWRAG